MPPAHRRCALAPRGLPLASPNINDDSASYCGIIVYVWGQGLSRRAGAAAGSNNITQLEKLRILIADDHEVIRHGVRAMIEKEAGWEVCGEAVDGRKAVALAEKLKPDVVVLDIGMPELNGLDAARQIKRALPKTEVLISTGEESDQLIHEVFATGARS